MTEEEFDILNLLADIWNAYLNLPVQLDNDRLEFMHIVHDAQRMILAREALRHLYKEELK